MDDLLKIGAAYIRVSDERQDEYSPDSQLKKVREYAAKDGYMIPDEYVFYDDGISGKNTKKRDDFNRMIATAKEKDHPFDRIYVWKFSRFARNQEQSMVYKNMLRKIDVSVVSVSEQIPEGPFGSLIERVIEWYDEFYLINLGEEVDRGMLEKLSRGEPVTAPSYGYKMGDKMYIPDEESGAADIVREVFQRYADGEKQRAIAISLGERGVRTKFGNLPENRWVDYMLHNSVYIGKLRWTTGGIHAIQKRDFDNPDIIEEDGNHEPLISMELWDKVQKMLKEQKAKYPKYAKRQQPIAYMLKGLVKCSNCGGALAMTSFTSGKTKVHTLQCCNYAKARCNVSHNITMTKIEATFIEGLKQAIGDKKFTINPTKPKAKKNEIDYDKLIAVEEKRLERAKNAYLAEIDTIEQYGQNKKEITAKIEDLKARRDKETTPEINVKAFTKKVKGVLEFIEREDVTAEAKNEALHTITEKIVYEKAKGNVAIYFHDV